MRQALLLSTLLLAPAIAAAEEAVPSWTIAVPNNPKIDAESFTRYVAEAVERRASHLLSPEEFSHRAAEGAVVLDARSRRYFDELHVQGAVSLPYTEFTAATLAAAVPSFDTPILIYCNNNFSGAEEEFATKIAPAALNLSTYVALLSYGYKNVWELGELLDVRDPRLELVGTNAGRYRGGAGTADATGGTCEATSAGCSGMITQSTR